MIVENLPVAAIDAAAARSPLWLAALLVATAVIPASAHEGEDHGPAAVNATPAPALDPNLPPRFEATSTKFALLGVLEGDQLVLYLDRYATNEPVTGARIELDNGARKQAAQARADGTSVLPAGALAQTGSHELAFLIDAGERADLLTGRLRVDPSAPPAPAPPAARGRPTLWLAGGGALALGALGGLMWRRRRAGPK